MTVVVTQDSIDHINAAQIRTAADTGLLQKRATVTVPAGSPSVALPAELVEIQGVFSGTDELRCIPTVDYMRLVTGTSTQLTGGTLNTSFIVVSHSLYVWPTPAVDLDLSVYYTYRPALVTDQSTLELQGGAERLIERLASAYLLLDDGQPELGQTELGNYQKDATRLAKRNRAAQGGGGQFRLVGRPRR